MKRLSVCLALLAICQQLPAEDVSPVAAVNLTKLQDQYVQIARSRTIDDYIPCELEPQDNENLKNRKVPAAAKSARDFSGAISQLNTQGITIDSKKFADKLRASITDPNALELAVDSGYVPKVGETAQQTIDNKSKAVNAVQNVAASHVPPQDVACVMTMLPWTVAADSFGRHVADQFIAFQVVVRNLNMTDEFMMHNVSVAVDVGDGGRFYSGVDKMVVRNSQNHGQYYDRRAMWTRILEAAGDIAAGAAPYGSADIRSGISVFRAAFVPGLEKVFPDRYTSQINALNDLGFSSSSAYKIVVPVKGAAPFVTFLPADIFSRKPNDQDGAKSIKKKKFHYEYWSAYDLNAFLESTYVAVSGIHVKEEKNTLPSVTSMDCHGNPKTSLDINNPTCDVTGQNLDKASSIKLTDASGASGPSATGALTLTSGQNTAGTVKFSSDDTKKLTASTYSVSLTQTSGGDVPTPVTISLPVSIASTPALSLTIGGTDCSVSDCSLTITGTGLMQVKGAFLEDSTDTSKSLATGDVKSGGTPTSIVVHFNNLSLVPAGHSYTLSLRNSGGEAATATVSVKSAS